MPGLTAWGKTPEAEAETDNHTSTDVKMAQSDASSRLRSQEGAIPSRSPDLKRGNTPLHRMAELHSMA